MTRSDLKKEWEGFKHSWNNSSEARDIQNQFSDLLKEVKTSRYERDALKSSFASLKSNWSVVTSQSGEYERNAIRNDAARVIRSLAKFLSSLKRK